MGGYEDESTADKDLMTSYEVELMTKYDEMTRYDEEGVTRFGEDVETRDSGGRWLRYQTIS